MGALNRFPDRGELYGMLAFAGTGLGAFSTYLFVERIRGEPWQVLLAFLLGSIFILRGAFSYRIIDEERPGDRIRYIAIQAGLGIAAIYVSPLRGFFGILLLPLASQSVFLFPWRPALAIGVALFIASAGVFLPPYGWKGFSEAIVSYSPAYLFTIVFSFVTRDALTAREQAIRLTQELEAANTRLREQAAQTEELATTRERNRLAREIHDGVGHYLTVINIQLEAARSLLDSAPARAAEAVAKAAHLSREALDDVRRSVGSLRTEAPTRSLPDTLRDLVADAGLPVELELSGPPRTLSPAAEHALFRAAQEGLTNIRKHAAARHASVHLDFNTPAQVRLEVQDDGRGPADPGAGAPDAGFGLRGMRERVGLLGGHVETAARPGGGFQLTVVIPA